MTTSTPLKKRVLIVLSSATPTMGDGKKSGYYWSEVYHPYEVFTKAQFGVDFVSLTGTASPDEHSISTTEQLLSFELSALNAYKTSTHPIHADLARLRSPDGVKAADYSIVFFAGGHACLWDLPTATPLHKIAAEVYERGGVVGAVCHGPAVLGGLKLSNGDYLVKGKRANAFTVEEEEKVGAMEFMRANHIPTPSDLITKAGGLYEKGGTMKDYVIDDQRLVTGQNPMSAESTAQRCVEVLLRHS